MKIDVIGDVHGCTEELHELFKALGYWKQNKIYIHPDARIPIFLGDITDRGPASIQVINLIYDMVVVHHKAKYVPGNHCNKLYRYFLGNNVQIRHGLETTVAEYNACSKKEQERIKRKFMTLVEQAPLYLQIPEVQAIVAHAGIKESYIGHADKKVESFVLYGDVTGNTDMHGRPIRKDWAQDYHGSEWIVYGHTPVNKPRIVNKTINIDTGCVFGNALSAFRLPEEKIIAVPSNQPYMADKFRSFPS
ncbi:bis(5'-nucleosyl)-tetraphosphatase PrpE [Virgibacillus sp. NKC19-3]|uniref:bis(5'-nucleosyl)-tetraphosphatase PrpE n=1 Tax=Virgibacillus saliphilus TaxID=2831674 RepID=UPI001C9B6C11|nr:bis(5'-nucleosyl)-tetraphosphatase PrpE [Virgibacillus sp. NKC19-3]MBY7143122.1 bis(5'-nucleosyl)-tetraphosphatase PrpE [Virgibacillus sp. NKC19-3]